MQNIALIKEYHERWPRRKAEKYVNELLSRFGMLDMGPKRNPSLTSEEKFVALLMRAALMEGEIILIDRPFVITPDLERAELVINALQRLEELFSQCIVLDYLWNEKRYEIVNEAPIR